MKTIALLLFALAFTPLATAEEKPSDRMSLIDPALLGFGPPGAAVTSTFSQPLEYSSGPGSLELIETRVRLPLFGKRLESGWLFGANLVYEYTAADFDGVLGLGDTDLQAFELQLSAAYLPPADSGWMGLLIASPILATDFQNVGADDFGFRLIAVAGYQFSPEFTLAISGFFEQFAGEQIALPGIGILWRPSQDWIIQLTPPIVAVGWKATEDLTLGLTAYPSGGGWNVEEKSSGVDAVILTGFRVGAGAEYRLGEDWRVSLLAGVNIGGEVEFRDQNERELFQSDLEPSAFGLIGITRRF